MLTAYCRGSVRGAVGRESSLMSPNGRITFEILGPLRAFDGAVQLDLGASKQRAVLAFLLLHANKPVTPNALIDGIWAENPPENGANVIQKYVAGLRRVLEPARFPRTSGHLITLTEAGYLLTVDDGGPDLALFDQTVARARDWRSRGQIGAAVELLRCADQMWRGEPLAGLGGPAIDTARSLLIERRGAAKEMWADMEMQLGHHSLMIPTLAEAVAQFPLREGLRYLYILALYRSGRQAEALASYDETRRLLSDEFGIDPSERLRELHRLILQADPRLNGNVAGEQAVAVPASRQLTTVEAPTPAATHDYGADRESASSTAVPARTVALGLAGIAVPLLSCGFATWAVMILFAVYRRSRLIAFASVAYLAMASVVVLDIFGETQKGNSRRPGHGGVACQRGRRRALRRPAGIRHSALPARRENHRPDRGEDTPRRRPRPGPSRPLNRRPPRHRPPAYAPPIRRRRPGRRQVTVPREVLIGLGLPTAKAEAILLDRHSTGPLTSPDDLVTRGLLTQAELARLRDFILVPAIASTDTAAVPPSRR